ncbi:MAG: DUF2807 domain-containing protein [Lewinellaceae bacterium]|nr:DUF2807 domain-containing protein [Lewinellaceae bacterium]
MKTITKLSVLLFLALGMSACDPFDIKGSGALVNEVRNPSDFDQVSISVPGKIRLQKGPDYQVDIQIESSLVPYLETEVRNGRLDVYFSRNTYDVDDLEITITAPDFKGIDVSGSAALLCEDQLSGDVLDLNVSGSGSMLLNNILLTTVQSKISGSGAITLKGVAEHLEANISGSGNLEALDCPVKTADLTISGSGSIRCEVYDQLKANISGSGCVYYKGSPVLDVSTSGSGKVKKMD